MTWRVSPWMVDCADEREVGCVEGGGLRNATCRSRIAGQSQGREVAGRGEVSGM